jgi:hypothetical protein
VLVPELNSMLARRNFYDPEIFRGIALPHEAEELLARVPDKLGKRELFRFNRIAFQSAVECVPIFRMDLAGLPGRYYAKWLISGDRPLIDLATRAVRAAERVTIFGAHTDLHEGGISASVAMAYDAFHSSTAP